MVTTLYATFRDSDQAHRAAGALMDSGVMQEQISLILPEGTTIGAKAADPAPPPPARGTDFATPDPGRMGHDDRPFRSGAYEAADRAADTISETWPETTEAFGADPDTHSHGRGPHDHRFGTHDHGHADGDSSADRSDVGRDGDQVSDDTSAPGSGITTTTAADAGAGALKGAGIGAAAGVAAAIAAVAVPGVGIVLGGGALATAVAGALGATAAGAVAGGVYGLLREQGMPSDAAGYYQGELKSGNAVLGVTVTPDGVDRPTIVSVLNKYGAANVRSFDRDAYDVAA